MRSILALFAIAALGFIVILQKKDAPDATLTKAKAPELKQAGKHNWMKHALDGSHAVAQNTTRTRKEN
jgi:hypothetical protein